MASDERWYFTKEQLANSPSRRCGIDADKELSYRQQAANFIQDMGQRLVVSQLCINTAIVYMHRFYVFHSLTQFHRNAIAVAALFLAAKVEEQPRKLEHVIKMAYMCLHRDTPPPDVRSEQFLEQAQDLVFNENVLLQTLGFDVAIDHPHTHVVRCCQLVKASKDLAQTSYFMASNSLHLTTMCLQYKPTVVACFCIHLACRWSNWEIPQSTEGRQWFWYVDRTVTASLLQELTEEFLHIFDKCPSRLKKKIMSISANQSPSSHPPSLSNSPFDAEPRKVSPATTTDGASTSGSSAAGSTSNLASSLSAAIAAYSNRSHHTQEKQDEKKSASMGSSTSRAAVDYREYREKKERERLEREKAAAIGCHVADPSKSHHSHLHKTASNASVPSKHQVPVQKGSNLHHNHYHRPDMKVGQPVPQRHSASSQSREPSRDPSRQRLSREHAAGIAHSSHSHGNLDSSSSESHRTNGGATQDSSLHGNLQEKMSNNNYSGHRLNALDKHQTHDKRMYRVEDPRLKSAKYADISKIDQRRKAETLEQRSEEVRKLIEKPLPPPKQTDLPYLNTLMNAQQKQQAHHSKYNQQDKSQSSSLTVDAKHPAGQNALSQDKSPSALVSASSSQVPQKSAPKTQMYNQHIAQNVSQILKDTIKNGNSQSCLSLNNMDDTKRSRTTAYEDSIERNSVDVQQILHTPPSKHRSLFSPETPTTREPHTQSARPKSKQKTPPVAATKIKERVSPFASSPTSQDSLATKRPSSNDGPSSNKKLRTSNIGEGESSIKIKQEIKIEDTSSLEAMKMLGRVPDLIQPIRDNPLLPSNGKNSSASSIINDLKPPEIIKPFESDPHRFYAMSQHKSLSINMHMLSNGMDLNAQIKQEPVEHRKKELPDSTHYLKKESLGHKVPETSLSHVQPKVEYTSPMKSVQSISALLQEPLAPMPSLLQGLQQHNQASLTQQVHQEQLQLQQSQQQSLHHPLMEHQLPMVTECLSLPIASDNPMPIASTVDISALSCVPLTQQTNNSVVESVSSVAMLTTVPPSEEKRSEHHKSEKKKKKEKHKHKDKEKSKEKHKHKHKDKDKDRHREKKDKERSEETPAAAPIKITIPKDKLNLSTESSPVIGAGSATSDKNISPHSTVLKIKIPKERLKGADNVPGSSPVQPPVVQGPLKIKIRTDGISRSSTAPAPSSVPSSSSLTSSANGSSGTAHHVPSSSESFAIETASRKRVEAIGGDSSGSSLAKKQMMMPATGYGQGHRPGERQNGRHYNTGSNNKVRGRGGRQHHGGRGPPPHHATAAGQRGSAGGHYQRDGYGNGRGGRNHHQAPYHPHQPHHPPTVRGDVSGYVRGPGRVDQTAESYFYANYPPSMFNTPAGYMYDSAYQQYYQQQFQQQSQGYSMYPAGNGLMITPDGAINTSMPPPPSSSSTLLPNHPYPNRNMMPHQSATSVRQEDLQSLPQPPLAPPPSPPPLPNGPPPPPPPPPPSMPE